MGRRGNFLLHPTLTTKGKVLWKHFSSSSERSSMSNKICAAVLMPFFVSRITGKEEMVDLYQEEAEVFKEKNYHHKERVLN